MILALVLLSIAVGIQSSIGYPLGIYEDAAQGFDIATNFDPYYGPWSADYLRGGRWWGGYGGPYGGFGYGYGGPYGGFGYGYGGGYARGFGPYDGYADAWDLDYYGPPVRTVDVGRERRDYLVTETDNFVRDQTTMRVPPRFRAGPWYGAWPGRRVFSGGIAGPRTSSIRTGGDMMFMRR